MGGFSYKGLDIALTVIAFISAYFIKRYLLPKPFSGLTTEPHYYIVLFLIIIVWYLCFAYFRLYESYRKQRLPLILWQMVKAVKEGKFPPFAKGDARGILWQTKIIK